MEMSLFGCGVKNLILFLLRLLLVSPPYHLAYAVCLMSLPLLLFFNSTIIINTLQSTTYTRMCSRSAVQVQYKNNTNKNSGGDTGITRQEGIFWCCWPLEISRLLDIMSNNERRKKRQSGRAKTIETFCCDGCARSQQGVMTQEEIEDNLKGQVRPSQKQEQKKERHRKKRRGA